MKFRLAKLPDALARTELPSQVKLIRRLLQTALEKTGVECYVIDKPKENEPERIIIRFSNHGDDASHLPIGAVWTQFSQLMQREFRANSLYGGIDHTEHGMLHYGTRYESTISEGNTLTVTTSWTSGQQIEMTLAVHAQGANAKTYCKVEQDPASIN